MRTSKIVPCIDCGVELPRKELNRHRRCKECAWKVMGETMEQLHAHEGPQYEKWRKAIKSTAQKL